MALVVALPPIMSERLLLNIFTIGRSLEESHPSQVSYDPSWVPQIQITTTKETINGDLR